MKLLLLNNENYKKKKGERENALSKRLTKTLYKEKPRAQATYLSGNSVVARSGKSFTCQGHVLEKKLDWISPKNHHEQH